MPGFKKHLSTGVMLGSSFMAILNLYQQADAMQNDPDLRFDWVTFLSGIAVGAVIGGAAAALPDILEPADTPDHRKFFHSFTTAGIICTGLAKLDSSRFTHGQTALLQCASVGYLSHLFLDAHTPNSLPLV